AHAARREGRDDAVTAEDGARREGGGSGHGGLIVPRAAKADLGGHVPRMERPAAERAASTPRGGIAPRAAPSNKFQNGRTRADRLTKPVEVGAVLVLDPFADVAGHVLHAQRRIPRGIAADLTRALPTINPLPAELVARRSLAPWIGAASGA